MSKDLPTAKIQPVDPANRKIGKGVLLTQFFAQELGYGNVVIVDNPADIHKPRNRGINSF